MIIKLSKERLDRMFNNGYGIIRFKKVALIKAYSYKYMTKEFLWALIGIPVNLIFDIGKTLLYLLNFIPIIYIEQEQKESVKAKEGVGYYDVNNNYMMPLYCPICNTYLGDFETDEIVECPKCKIEVNTGI